VREIPVKENAEKEREKRVVDLWTQDPVRNSQASRETRENE